MTMSATPATANNNHGNKYDYDDCNMNNKMPQQWCLWRLHGGNSNNDNNNNDNSINNNNNSSHFAWSFNSTLINDFRWPGINEKCISVFFLLLGETCSKESFEKTGNRSAKRAAYFPGKWSETRILNIRLNWHFEPKEIDEVWGMFLTAYGKALSYSTKINL